jgi:hypothetical protein
MRKRLVPLVIFATLGAASLQAQSPPTAPAKPTPPARRAAAPPNPFGQQPGVTGARNPTDLKTVLYYTADALGMLRGPREVDWVLTMQLWGTGMFAMDGKPCRTTNLHAMVRYAAIPAASAAANNAQSRGESKLIGVPAMRVSATCAGSSRPQISVVAAKYAWNEEKVGINATPVPGAVVDRLLQLWTLIPESLVKAATMAGANTTVTFEGDKPVLAFPMPEPFQSASMKVWISPKIFRIDTNPAGQKRQFSHLIERSELRLNDKVIETTYADYGDWNEKDLYSMVLLPRRIVQKQNGTTTVDLTITKTDTFNPYVIMPIPANVAPAATQTASSK